MTTTISRPSGVHTIPRELVHRIAIAEVFVTSIAARSEAEFVTTAQLPRSHAYFGDHTGGLEFRYDPMMVMEAARQSGMAVVHSYFGIPFDRAFLLRTFNGTAAAGPVWEIEAQPAELELVTRVTRLYKTDDALTGLSVEVEVTRRGVRMLSVDSKFSWIERKQWDLLRRNVRKAAGLSEEFTEALPVGTRATPAEVGRQLASNVVISSPRTAGDATIATLVSDTNHATMFDHPVDHVPGSLQIEACRQLGVSALNSRTGCGTAALDSVQSNFTGFLELDRPSEITATVVTVDDGHATIRATIDQFGRTAAHFELGFTLPFGARSDR